METETKKGEGVQNPMKSVGGVLVSPCLGCVPGSPGPKAVKWLCVCVCVHQRWRHM